MTRRRRPAHPPFFSTVLVDARARLAHRGHPQARAGTVRLAGLALWLAAESDAFAAQIVYRAKARLHSLGVPVLPSILHRFAVLLAQVSIGDQVLVRPGLYIPHGQISISGRAELRTLVTVAPFVMIAPREGEQQGPTIGSRASIGTGAVIVGPHLIGDRASVGASAVVTGDVPPGTTVVGNPARPAVSAGGGSEAR